MNQDETQMPIKDVEAKFCHSRPKTAKTIFNPHYCQKTYQTIINSSSINLFYPYPIVSHQDYPTVPQKLCPILPSFLPTNPQFIQQAQV